MLARLPQISHAICSPAIIFSEWISVKTDLIDRIYESVVPELWPAVLDELADLTDSKGGLLFSARDRVLKWTASENLNDIFRSYVEDGWFPRCTRRVCLFGQSQPGFFRGDDFWTPDQIDSNPIYRDSLVRTGSAGRRAPACRCRPAIALSSASSASIAAVRSRRTGSIVSTSFAPTSRAAPLSRPGWACSVPRAPTRRSP